MSYSTVEVSRVLLYFHSYCQSRLFQIVFEPNCRMEMSTKMPSKFTSLRTFINVIKQTETSWRFTSICVYFYSLESRSSLDRVSRGNNAAIGAVCKISSVLLTIDKRSTVVVAKNFRFLHRYRNDFKATAWTSALKLRSSIRRLRLVFPPRKTLL